jgi:tagatose-1,6-bisphosphate aldolase non-catalytic subunit AgaZ/GatZ
MDEQVWFDNPRVLFDVNKVLKFWPTRKQTAAERVNSSTRFILYAASVLYLTRKDPRILVLALMVIAVI